MRLFIGIELPKHWKDALEKFQSELRTSRVTGSWKSRENFHLTLEFLGECEDGIVPLLADILKRSTQDISPFRLCLQGIGVFPTPSRPHTLWTGVTGDLGGLHSLHEAIHQELLLSKFVIEERKFSPHITLASRLKSCELDLPELQNQILGCLTVEQVTLFESKNDYGKRIYSPVYSVHLKSKKML